MDERVAELERLYREVGPQLWTYLRRRVADASVAEELLQETFVIVAKDFARLKVATSERAWIIGIARNLLHRHWRLAANRHSVPLSEDPAADNRLPEDPRLDAMRRAVARLPDTQRVVLELRLAQDLSYAEIAEALAIPIGTVRSRMHHAIAALRAWATETGIQTILET